MKNRYPIRKHRLNTAIHATIYTNFFLILATLISLMTLPLSRQPIPLHQLAPIKTRAAIIPPIVITIDEKGNYQSNTHAASETIFSLATLKMHLSKQFKIDNAGNTSICIKASPKVSYQYVLALIETLKSMGIAQVGLMIETHSIVDASDF